MTASYLFTDDKRCIPSFTAKFWTERKSLKKWRDCKYCYRSVPVFRLSQGEIGNHEPICILICCWECGSGLEQIETKTQHGRAA